MTMQTDGKRRLRRYEQAPKKRTRRGWVRRFNHLVSDFAADLGGGALSNADNAMVRAAAGLVLKSEQCAAMMLAGEPTDENTIVRLSNSVMRILTALGAKHTKRAWSIEDTWAAIDAGAAEEDK
jgi:hypothetical protein